MGIGKRVTSAAFLMAMVVAVPAAAERFDCSADEFTGCPGGTSFCHGDFIEVEECIGDCYEMEGAGPVFNGTAFCKQVN